MRTKAFPLLPRSIPLVLVLGAGCASGPRVYVNQDPEADFGRYRTYDFETPMGTDKEDDTRSLLTIFVRTAIAHELDERGYRKVEADPDLRVNAYAETEEKIRTYESPAAPYGYYHYRSGHYGVWGGYAYETHVDQYTEGTLTIDLVDEGRAQLVWEGTIVGQVGIEEREAMQATVDAAVGKVFERFPYRAGPVGAAGAGGGDGADGAR